MQGGASRKKSGIESPFPGKKIDIWNVGQQVPQNTRGIPAFLPPKNSGVWSRGNSRIRAGDAQHHHAKARWVHARHYFLHRQVLGIGVAFVSEGRRENCNHAVGNGLQLTAYVRNRWIYILAEVTRWRFLIEHLISKVAQPGV